MRENEALLRRITDNMLDMISLCDGGGIVRYASPSHKSIVGHAPDVLIGRPAFDFVHPDDLNKVMETFQTGISNASPVRSLIYRYMHADGRYLWLESHGSLLFDANEIITGAVICTRDITQRREAEEKLKYLSLHDPVTGLYNRVYFEQEMRRLGDGRHNPVGIIISDVDGLKLVNDTLGHGSGDKMLVAVAGVINNTFRKSDMIARIGGDEFAILLPKSDEKVVARAVQRIRDAIEKYNIDNPEIPLSVSIGYSVGNKIPVNMDELFKEADNNMYREKLYHSQSTRSAIVQTLLKALKERDFITNEHVCCLQDLVAELAADAGLPEHKVAELRLLAQFHDLGKVGIPNRILFKKEPLTPEEVSEMNRHCEIGYRIARSAPDLAPIADWVLKHHEWWNGKGYPLGLKGEDIPLECRILAIADAYHAMTSERPYRKAMSRDVAVAELRKCAGIQFDPELVPRFIKVLEKLGKR